MYEISREEVMESWQAVRQASGGSGIDGQTIKDVEAKLEDELYKVWNRMSSGSYQAQPVKIIAIPKAKGGVRHLGIPTVIDRVAQGVIKNRLGKVLEPHFHEDSYAYRPGKSAIDAVMKARERCFGYEWVVEIDIKGFFDNLDHEILLEMLGRYTQDKLVLLYAKKFLKARGVDEEGDEVDRSKGTPQGGVISPLLANLYLHEAFDKWMEQKHSSIQFERYADDIVIHCVSQKQAQYIRDMVGKRLMKYELELNHEKTRIIYAGKKNDYDDQGHKVPRKFTFLGYDFKPRYWNGKIVFTPGIGSGALMIINQKLKQLRLGSTTQDTMDALAKTVNSKLRGWMQYYGQTRPSELYKLGELVDKRIVKWLKHKFKIRVNGKAWKRLKSLKETSPRLFHHWYGIKQLTRRAV
jgi:RNA-directed DNA polymerase